MSFSYNLTLSEHDVARLLRAGILKSENESLSRDLSFEDTAVAFLRYFGQKKIAAIKAIRAGGVLGLKDSKELYEKLQREFSSKLYTPEERRAVELALNNADRIARDLREGTPNAWTLSNANQLVEQLDKLVRG